MRLLVSNSSNTSTMAR